MKIAAFDVDLVEELRLTDGDMETNPMPGLVGSSQVPEHLY